MPAEEPLSVQEIPRWNAFVLTDSLYISALVFAVWSAHCAAESRLRNWRHVAFGVVALAAVALIRPEGWLVAWLAVAYWLRARGRLSIVTTAAILAACGWFFLSTSRLIGTLGGGWPTQSILQGQTIWGYAGWRVAMPPAAVRVGQSETAMALRYAAAHPLATATLLVARVAVLFGEVRPFYSRLHNLVIVVWLLPVYAFGVRGWWLLRDHPLARFCLAVIAMHAGLVAISHADSDGRFLAHLMPLIDVFAAVGVADLLRGRARWLRPRDGTRLTSADASLAGAS